jgi:dTDP-4-dehydrorhamnose 3,5-epimerase-like enzyme
VRGSFVLVTLQNRRYRYIGLCEACPAVVTIPPGIPHGAVNMSKEPCVLVNAVLRHGDSHPKDYQPMQPIIPYDFTAVQTALKNVLLPQIA